MLNSWSIPKFLYGVLLIVHVTLIALTLEKLPDPFATHFNTANEPDRWLSHKQYWVVQALISVITPALLVILLSLSNRLPSYLVNLPNKDYWLHPDRQAETQQKIIRFGWWMACIIIAFCAGMHYNLVVANQSETPTLHGRLLLITVGLFIFAVVFWLKQLHRVFSVPDNHARV